jgi:gliding motility-associated-like protein
LIFKNKDIYVPTGFSPDNDGHNDKLYPMTVGIKQMNVFKVFNRWGLMVYNNKSADATTGWDGFYINMPQPMDTYSWIAQGLDEDGNLISKTGHVILIR